jgi:hypothetical protein
MKKGLLIGALVGIVVSALVMAGFAFAQTPTPAPQFPFGQGMMGGRQRGGMGQGMMGGSRVDGQYGPMHEYMEKAFAEALGISQDDLETALAGGKTMWQVAQDKGMTLEQFQKVMLDARTNAFKQMVADGVITQAQADWMVSRMGGQGGQNGRFGGQGGCPGMGGYNGGTGSRWNTPPSQTAPTTSSSNGAY